MGSMAQVGERIRNAMPAGMSQRQLADRAGMTPDALSRALNAQRGLSPIEVAGIAGVLNVDTHWLITGAPDPFALTVAARHTWDAGRRQRHNPGQQDDQPMLDRVVDLYRAAFPHGPAASVGLPDRPGDVRTLLGADFVRTFADNVERHLSIDVLRIPGLATDYSLRLGQRGVIVLATQASWFRSNWSLAHELGHLALGHHSAYDSTRKVQRDEQSADSFAANLLIASSDLDEIGTMTTEAGLARMVWKLGVSTEALRNRLTKSRTQLSREVAEALQVSTPRLLRDNVGVLDEAAVDTGQITAREQAASARRFPLTLLSALQTQTEIGAASPLYLAWALDVPVDDIDFPEPDDSGDEYERMLADRPSAAEWSTWLAAQVST